MGDVRKKLSRMKHHLSSSPAPKQEEVASISEKVVSEEEKLWNTSGVFRVSFTGKGSCFVRKKSWPLAQTWGDYTFQQGLDAIRSWRQLEGDHPLSTRGVHEEEVLFFDIETTGLGHGAGNHMFLIGTVSIRDHRVHLTQYVLPAPGNEPALFQAFLQECKTHCLVTFNGKSFDWPIFAGKHAGLRDEVQALPQVGHVDLYHASRRLYRPSMESVRLQEMERNVLGVHRQDDVPGHLAGMIYQDYLERKNPEGMLQLMKHNEDDILSLVTLYAHLSETVLHPGKALPSVSWEVARWWYAVGAFHRASDQFASLRDANERTLEAMQWYATSIQKQFNKKQALPSWEQLAGMPAHPAVVTACIECAKFYEHDVHDFTRALHYTERALQIVQEIGTMEDDEGPIIYRLKRLLRKQSLT